MSTVDRVAKSEEVFSRLFGPRDVSAPEQHPEFMQILRSVVFGDVFSIGELDDQTRELVTCTVLGTLQALPQLKVHADAALKIGVSPVELMEAIYQLAPILGFPRTLNAIAVVSEVLTARGEQLPLASQATTNEDDRHEKGRAIQQELYGDEIARRFAGLPGEFANAVPDLLTDFLFGDFATRTGLDTPTRELLQLISLAALSLGQQLPPHTKATLDSGNSYENVLAALIQAAPYMGMPAAINAIGVLASAAD